MQRVLLFIGAIILFGCHDPKKDYPIPSKKDINEVLSTVISQQKIVYRYDSTGVVLNATTASFIYNALDSLPLTINLVKVSVESDGRAPHKTVDTSYLFNIKKPASFSRADIPYLIFQNTILHGTKVDKHAAPQSRFTNDNWLHSERKNKHIVHPYYNLSIPIFSLDQQQAYVQIEVLCGFNLWSAYSFVLKKKNGKWKIVRQELIGIS